MGRRGKYANVKPKRNAEMHETIISYLGVLTFMAYLYWGKKVMSGIQWAVFGNTRTLLFMSPSIPIAFLEFLSGPAFIMSMSFYVYYRIRQRKLSRIYEKPVHRYSRDLKWSGVVAAASLAMILLSFFTYCRADSNGLYVRDMGTLFREKRYAWDSVDSVEITYDKNSRGSNYTIGYWINFDRFSINVQDGSLSVSREQLDRSGKEIHRIIRSKGVRVLKDIDTETDEIWQYLKDIGAR